MFGRRAEHPLPAGPWSGGGTTAEVVTVEAPGVLGRRTVPCARFADGATFRLDDLRDAAAGRATILETVAGDPLAFLFRADAPSADSTIAPLAEGQDPGSWLLAYATGYDGAVSLGAVLAADDVARLGAWASGR
ncbi:hypothetical protein [Microbacterium sp. JZ31]|uniref:hypothetical protein n=1 Tax=Microbacterium sp. JZ31 TaxID=1906274 RepID=UPI001932BE8E|nr:hypothetical protein [Microbacterium sp. JZ31]